MKEKLIIKNFGPIRHVDLDLGKFNVLIGEQATGKSTVAKVLAICRYYSYVRPEPRVIGGLSNFSKGLVDWGINEFVTKGSHIYYECEHYSLSVDRETPQFSTTQAENSNRALEDLHIFMPTLHPKSEEFINLLAVEKEILARPRSAHAAALPPSFFENNVASIMDNPFYLPTERGLQSVFSLGKGGIQNTSDWLFNQFAQLDRIARLFINETVIEPLGVTYKNVEGRGYVRKKADHEFYSLANGASGYQSSIPIVLVSEYYHQVREEPKTLIIEEPELNLFPNAQQKLMQYLVDGVISHDNTILLTTHSPYILTSLNNMLFAYHVGEKNRIETEKILDRNYWINPEEVFAYRMLSNGLSEDIFDRDEGLVKAEKIDEISGILNEQFSSMLNIDFKK